MRKKRRPYAKPELTQSGRIEELTGGAPIGASPGGGGGSILIN